MEIAELVDRKQAARQWLDEHEHKAGQIRNKIRFTTGGGVVTLCLYRNGQLRVYGARNIGHVFYRSLQLTPPDRVREQLKGHPAGTGHTWTAITPDELLHYESDFLFIAVQNGEDQEQIRQWQRTNPAWVCHPAVRRGRVYFIDWGKWKIYAPIGINQQLEEIGQLLTRSDSL